MTSKITPFTLEKAAMRLGGTAMILSVFLPWQTSRTYNFRSNNGLGLASGMSHETTYNGWQALFPALSLGLLVPIGIATFLIGIWVFIFNESNLRTKATGIITVVVLLLNIALLFAAGSFQANIGDTYISGSGLGIILSGFGIILALPRAISEVVYKQKQ